MSKLCVAVLAIAIVSRVAWELLNPVVPTLLGAVIVLAMLAYTLRR